MSIQPYPIVTADYCLANNITPKAILSVAQFHDRVRNKDMARRLRALAREVDAATGYFARYRGRRRKAANDNGRAARRMAA